MFQFALHGQVASGKELMQLLPWLRSMIRSKLQPRPFVITAYGRLTLVGAHSCVVLPQHNVAKALQTGHAVLWSTNTVGDRLEALAILKPGSRTVINQNWVRERLSK